MILYVKQDGQWVEVPAIRGTSVYLSTSPTRIPADTSSSNPHNAGWRWVMYDERTGTNSTVEVYDGTDGQGAVSIVDGVSPDAGGGVTLNAIRYSSQTLTSAQQSIARGNINAMQNVVGATNGQVPIYDSTSSSWVPTTVNTLNSPSTAAQVLYSTSSSGYTWTSFSAISTSQINSIVI